MRIGDSRANEVIRQIVRQKSSDYDLTRKSDSNNGRFGEHDEAETTINNVSLYLFNPGESALDTQYGDRLDGDLDGLALPSADVQDGDELTYDGTLYEVDGKPELVKDGVLKSFTLVKLVNDA